MYMFGSFPILIVQHQLNDNNTLKKKQPLQTASKEVIKSPFFKFYSVSVEIEVMDSHS